MAHCTTGVFNWMEDERLQVEFVRRIESLNETFSQIHSTTHFKTISKHISRLIVDFLEVDRSIFILIDPEKIELNYVGGWNYETKHFLELTPGVLKTGITDWVLKNKKPYCTNDAQTDPLNVGKSKQHAVDHNSGPVMVVPIMHDQRIFGTLTAVRKKVIIIIYLLRLRSHSSVCLAL